MKKLIIIALIGFVTFANANVNAIVSILPQKTFLSAIGGDKVNISTMVLPGSSPHTYEPKASQMRDISKANIYFSIDVEFEHTWLPKFTNINKSMNVVDLTKGIRKMPIEEHDHHEEGHVELKSNHDEHMLEKDSHDDHDEDGLDPHIWTSPSNVKIIAKNILNALIKADIKNKAYYTNNYNKLINHIHMTDKNIKKILINTHTGAKFMVFHPAWGYFARDYGLTQFAIESGGKKPKPKRIAYLIREAKEEKVHAIFTAPEFSQKVANQIANEVGVKVIKVSSLNPNWSENLINLAKAIANKTN